MHRLAGQLLTLCLLLVLLAFSLMAGSTVNRADNDLSSSANTAATTGSDGANEVFVPVSVTILARQMYATTTLTPALDSDGAAGCVVSIAQIKDVLGNNVSTKMRSYTATLTYDRTRLNVLAVRHSTAFPGTEIINNRKGTAEFSGTATQGVTVPCDLAFLVLRLTGTMRQPVTATLTFTDIRDAYGNSIVQTTPVPQKQFLRGDAKPDGTVNLQDALYILGYLGRTIGIGEGSGRVNAVNAASASYDGKYDKITLADVQAILR